MSKNIVDSVIEMNSPLFGLLPSLRQVDYNGGYVNNWTTESFYEYVRSKSNITIQRDHGGINQGYNNEYNSFTEDSKYMDIIHIDPWKKYSFFEDGIKETIRNIKHIHNFNSKVKYEVGTEEAIRKFDLKELVELISELKIELTTPQFDNIQFLCIQSGVGLDLYNGKNTGTFSLERLRLMNEVCKKFNKKSKEHNGDYLSKNDIEIRFENGLNSINIGTKTLLNTMSPSEIDEFYQICLESKKWEKWITEDFDINNKEKLILVCGHYNYDKLTDVLNLHSNVIKNEIKNKLNELITYA